MIRRYNLKKENTSFLPIIFSKFPIRSWTIISPEIGRLRPEMTQYLALHNSSEAIKLLFPLNVNSKRLQFLIIRIENGPTVSEMEGKSTHSSFSRLMLAAVDGYLRLMFFTAAES